jgi:hypothetical protein
LTAIAETDSTSASGLSGPGPPEVVIRNSGLP